MEPTQLISQEWVSLSGQYTAEEADFMTQFLGGNYSCFPSNVANANDDFMCFSQGSDNSSTDHSDNIFSTITTSNGPYFCDPATDIDSLSMFSSPQYLDDNFIKQVNYESIDEGSGLEPGKLAHVLNNNLQTKREHEMMFVSEEDRTKNMENPAKRFRSSIEVSENMRNVRSNNEEGLMWDGSNNCFSHIDSIASMEINGGTSPTLSPKEHEVTNLCRKSRARNGSSTDSQSIYARRRRERINERLRMLQTLVPNGTKVDISTMLDEAVQYVKFLHLQIKVLSSDDMWMYAPIAYNGINIGLDLTFSSPTN